MKGSPVLAAADLLDSLQAAGVKENGEYSPTIIRVDSWNSETLSPSSDKNEMEPVLAPAEMNENVELTTLPDDFLRLIREVSTRGLDNPNEEVGHLFVLDSPIEILEWNKLISNDSLISAILDSLTSANLFLSNCKEIDHEAIIENILGQLLLSEPVQVVDDIRSLLKAASDSDIIFHRSLALFVIGHKKFHLPRIAVARLANPTNFGGPQPTKFLVLAMGNAKNEDMIVQMPNVISTVLFEDDFYLGMLEAKNPSDIENVTATFRSRMADGKLSWNTEGVRPSQYSHGENTPSTITIGGPILGTIDEEDGGGGSGGENNSSNNNNTTANSNLGTINEIHVQTSESKHHHGPTGSRYLFKGILADIRRRLPHYISDYTDGLKTTKTLSATCGMFFAVLAPTVAFGGMLLVATEANLGIVEMIYAQMLYGVIFAVLGGNPLLVLRPSGPAMTFVALVYALTSSRGIAFFPFYTWVGIWVSLILFICSVTNASVLIRYFTPFGEEVFEALVSTIFIGEGIKQIIHYFDNSGHHTPAESVLSTVLLLMTAWIALTLKDFRNSQFLSPVVRLILSDMAMAISIVITAGVAAAAKAKIEVPVLNVPNIWGGFEPSTPREWFVPFWELPGKDIALSLYPGILMALLFFVEQNVTVMLLAKPTNNLKKGMSIHYDLFLLSFIIFATALFGLPIGHATCPHSPLLLRSLATYEETMIDGVMHRRILKVKENRIVNLALNILIGLLLLVLPLFRLVPVSVVYGLFLFLGVSTLRDNPFFIRITLLATQPSLYPKHHLIRRIKPWAVHVYTSIQMFMLALIWVFKILQGIIFPLIIIAMIPVRFFILPRIFTKEQLSMLDTHNLTPAPAQSAPPTGSALRPVKSGDLDYTHTEKEPVLRRKATISLHLPADLC